MALIQKGKNYYIVYVHHNKQIWRKTGTDNKELAQAIHDQFKEKHKADKQRKIIADLMGESTFRAPETKTSNRLLLSSVIKTAMKYRKLSQQAEIDFNRFVKSLPKSIQYCDQITPQMCLNYLQKEYSKQSAKTYNNNKNSLNSLFKSILVNASLLSSPFASIPNRRLDDQEHQRPFTDAECVKIFKAAPEPWKSAAVIAYHTGLRRIDIFLLQWSNIKDNIITVKPGKTARFGRSVQIPVHPQLAEYLNKLPRKSPYILDAYKYYSDNSHEFQNAFGLLLIQLKIKDTKDGLAGFNSFRNTFITRCRAAGIAEHAIRGIVGHTSSDMTDLYSRDISAALPVINIPAISL